MRGNVGFVSIVKPFGKHLQLSGLFQSAQIVIRQ